MKVSQEHLTAMTTAIDMPLEATLRQRWDALWDAIDNRRLKWSILKDYNDAHIDTALRHLVKNGDATK
ncbi:hypothetical protein LCGC14_1334090 [marine sediment metagenome]|uniref:Uncharacterized protein n=1 Tax=marine sediment metagenome TaxID=412755 RepID=A0A0F9KGE2_9ZZZZ